MTEEIKEILKKSDIDALSYAVIINYITNLQQKLQLSNDTLDTHNELIEKLQQDLDKANDIIEKDRQFNQGRLLDVAKLKEENERLNKLIDKTTNYYLKTLAKNGCMSNVAVEMFNLLEGNK